MYRVTLLRHAQSTGNAERIPQGLDDSPLTDFGRAQVQALSERWVAEGNNFDYIISSPLKRAKDTAEPVAASLGMEVETDELWLERDVGKMSSLASEEVDAQYENPKSTSPYHDSFGLGGEGQWQLYLRAGEAIHALLNKPPGAYLIVSHGGILNTAMYAILGLTPHAFNHGPLFIFRNCGFSQLSYRVEQHRWVLHGFNDTYHLEDLDS